MNRDSNALFADRVPREDGKPAFAATPTAKAAVP